MRFAGALMLLVGLATCLAACRREQVLGPPKAVPVAENGDLELRLMSFNVRYETAEDRGDRSWRRRISGIVRMIHEEKPDVIGVQEALHGQVADLWASLPDYGFAGDAREDGRRHGEYTGVFFRRDRFERSVDDAGTFWLSATPEKPGSRTWGNEIPRIASWVRFTDRATHRGFYVFNTHWDHRNQNSREHSALLLSRRIDSRRLPGLPVVLMGDFNAVETNAAVAYLSGKSATIAGRQRRWENGLVETYQALHPQDAGRTSLHFWRARPLHGIKVDHILAGDGVQVMEAAVRTHDQPAVSDHFPVTATVRFPAP
jgi:endonuclease/exonuclease/phosphatase family metal-dependent hydrolase